MKKIVFVLLVGLLAGVLVKRNSVGPMIAHSPSVLGHQVSQKTNPGLQVNIDETNLKKNTGREAFSFEDLDSFEQIERAMRNYSLDEIKNILAQSELRVNQNKWIEKVNSGQLNENEISLLAFELRQQTVARKIIIEALLEVDDDKS